MKPTGNTILITGGTSGIGRGLAVRFHEAGNTVIVAGRRKDVLDQVTTDHPGIEAVVLDIADPDSIAHVADTLAARHPRLDVLVNNAGFLQFEDLLDPTSVSAAEPLITTNLLGPIRLIDAFLPQLVTKDDAAILNVTSALAFVPLPAAPTYCATKAALHSYTESLRVQLAGTGVQVIEIAPPNVRTDLAGQQDDEHAMPLDDFLTETMTLLRTQPYAKEILLDRAKLLRHAEADGKYDDVLAMLSRR
jgi:uncharacterized oxidoreductase